MNREFVIGGQRSGKTSYAEHLGLAWKNSSPSAKVTVVATALAGDEEMRARIERHRQTRPKGFETVEAPHILSAALRAHAATDRLLIVDCLTLWVTNWLMPLDGVVDPNAWQSERNKLIDVLCQLSSPIVFVSNEIGLGVTPMARQLRQYIDELGTLNQAIAMHCSKVTWLVAGQAWTKEVSHAK